RWALAPPRRLVAGLDWPGRGPDVLLQALGANLRRRGGTWRLGTRARRLRMENGRCIGLMAEQNGQPLAIDAASVLLADGGFQGNPDLVRRFISPRPEALTQRNAGTGQGDALLMAEEAGAPLTDAAAFYGHLLARDSLTKPGLWPYPTMDTLAGGAIMVDRSGRRFIDEGLGGIAHSNALARSNDPLAATAIFDQAIWDTIGRAELVPPNPQLVAAGGTLISARDLATLAGKIGGPRRGPAAAGRRLHPGGPRGRRRPPRSAAHVGPHVRGVAQRQQAHERGTGRAGALLRGAARGRHLLHHGWHRDRRAGAPNRSRRRADCRALCRRLLHRRRRRWADRRLYRPVPPSGAGPAHLRAIARR